MRKQTVTGSRIYFLDNLRTFMIFLVVVLHSGIVYESSGVAGFFWIVYDFSTNPVVDVLQIIMDIFIMSTIFFISGYLTPRSLESKNSWAFIKTKLKRLMLPWFLGVLILMPLYKWIFLASRGLPQQEWTSYFHVNNGIFSQSWLWFLPILFIFDLIYLGLSRIKLRMPKISFPPAAAVVFIIGFAYSLIFDMLNLQGWTKNILLNFQNERLLIYCMLFLLGAAGYKQRIFTAEVTLTKFHILTIGTVWIPVVVYHYFYTKSTMMPPDIIFSSLLDSVLTWVSFHLSLAGLLYLLITVFRIYGSRQSNVSRELSANSYTVYIIHTIILGGIAWLLLEVEIPSIVKFLLLTITTYAVSTGLVSLYRKTRKSNRLVTNTNP